MKFLNVAGAAALSALAAVAQAPSVSQQLNTLLTANGLKADVSFLASDLLEGRGTPSRGLDLAAEYIASQFRRAGLEPVGDDGYFQTANFATVAANTEGLELSLDAGGTVVKAPEASVTLQDPAATDLSHAPVIKVSMDDQAAVAALTADQVAGKVLVIEAGAQPAGGGRGRGGAGFVGARGLKPAAVIMLQSAGGGGRGGAGAGRGGARPREASTLPSFATLACTDAAFRTALDAAASPTISLHIAAPKVEPVKLHNVVGLLRGSDPALKDTYLLVTGHYDHLGIRDNGTPDHIYNGADDDASGTSSVIEIANAMSGLPRPKRSILFMAVFGEELGDLGSHYYATHPIFPLAKTVVDLNLEQLGPHGRSGRPARGRVQHDGLRLYEPARGLRARRSANGYQGDQTREEQRLVLPAQRQRSVRGCRRAIDDDLGSLRFSGLSQARRRMAEAGLREYGQGGSDDCASDDRDCEQRGDS